MITALLASLALLGPPTLCRGPVCSCVPSDPVSATRSGHETIFEGRVLLVRDTTIWRTEGPRLLHVRRVWRTVTLGVDRVWNGVPNDTVQVLTGLGGGDCGYEFREGETYVVFADSSDPWIAPGGGGPLVTSICSHTTQAKHAEPIRDSLGTPLREGDSEAR
jgi:hypothetical protein